MSEYQVGPTILQDGDPVSSGGGGKETKSPDGEDVLSEAATQYRESDVGTGSGDESWDLDEFLEWEMDGDLERCGSEDMPDEPDSQERKEPDGYFDYKPPQRQRNWAEDWQPAIHRDGLRRSRSSEDTLLPYTPPDACFFDAEDIYDGMESPSAAAPAYLVEDVWEGSDVEEIETTWLVGMPRIISPKPVSASEALDFRAVLRALESVDASGSTGRDN